MKKAVFIIPYFGKLPYYFNIWAKTAEQNDDYDFWMITDDESVSVSAANIKLIKMTFMQFVKKVQTKFDFPIGLSSPRKLCDFRPAYGYIFEEDIGEYPYWGYCDVDVILGDLRHMIPIDKEYDKLFVHGHMTLIRNTPAMNRLFMRPVNGYESYRDILTDSENRIFDESSDGLNINLIAQQEGVRTYFDDKIADINPYSFLFKRSLYDYGCPTKKGRQLRREKICRQIFLWEDGKLCRYAIDKDHKMVVEEMRYFHFQKRNMEIDADGDCRSFLIFANRMVPFDGTIHVDTIKKYTHNCLIYPQYFRLKFRNIKNRIKGK